MSRLIIASHSDIICQLIPQLLDLLKHIDDVKDDSYL